MVPLTPACVFTYSHYKLQTIYSYVLDSKNTSTFSCAYCLEILSSFFNWATWKLSCRTCSSLYAFTSNL